MFDVKMVLYHLRFPRKGSKVGGSVQHLIHHQIDNLTLPIIQRSELRCFSLVR